MDTFARAHRDRLRKIEAYLGANLRHLPDLVAQKKIDHVDQLLRLLDELKIGLSFEPNEESQHVMKTVTDVYRRYDIEKLKSLVKSTERRAADEVSANPYPDTATYTSGDDGNDDASGFGSDDSSGYDSDQTVSVGEGLARVLLYCHGNFFKINKFLHGNIEKGCELIGMRDPGFYDSINTNPATNPTILSDGRLKRIFFNEFNVVIDVDCDYSGWATSPEQFAQYTIPRYIDMVSALHRDRWSFVIGLPNPTGAFSQRMGAFNEVNVRAIELILDNKYRRHGRSEYGRSEYGRSEYDYEKNGLFGKVIVYHSF